MKMFNLFFPKALTTLTVFFVLACLSNYALAMNSEDKENFSESKKNLNTNFKYLSKKEIFPNLPEGAMHILPRELTLHILSFLSLKDQAKIRYISSYFRGIVDEVISLGKTEWNDLSKHAKDICTKYFTVDGGIRPSIISSLISVRFSSKSDITPAAICKKLNNTNIHTIYLESNDMSDDDTIELAKKLKDTNVHTVILCNTSISGSCHRQLIDDYPLINWIINLAPSIEILGISDDSAIWEEGADILWAALSYQKNISHQ